MSDLEDRIKDISDLLTLPDVVSKINSLVRDPDTSAADITMVISTDIALSAKVLKLVNSPFYGFNRRITSINYAIVILGFNAIRNLALSAFMYDIYSTSNAIFDTREFWRFSICCAAGSQAIAKKIGYAGVDDAFMAGLLHDIGLVIMSQYFKDDFAKVINRTHSEGILVSEAEKLEIDYTHCEVGALLLDRWNLPDDIISVCRKYPSPDDTCSKLCAIVHITHVFCRALLLGNPGDNSIPAISPWALKLLEIEDEQIGEFVNVVLEAAETVSSFLELD